jgi:putative ABC transport system permease protein
VNRIRSLPGVKQASAISSVPFGNTSSSTDYEINGLSHQKKDVGLNAQIVQIEPSFFTTMQIPLLRGRMLSDSDTAKAKPVVVIDQFLAHRWFGDRDPIGQEIRTFGFGDGPWRTVVGVVGEIKNKSLAEGVIKETLYFPIAQVPATTMTFVLKTAVDPKTLVGPLRAAIREIDPQLPIFDIQTMAHRVADSMMSYRSPMIVLLVFGGTALIMASLGLYGVLTYSVSQRVREIGIRIALGAEPRVIIRLVVLQGLKMTLVGLALGLAGTFAVNRLLGTILYGVGTTDPLTYLTVSGFLLAIALIACYLPARRATKVDPVVALRAE